MQKKRVIYLKEELREDVNEKKIGRGHVRKRGGGQPPDYNLDMCFFL